MLATNAVGCVTVLDLARTLPLFDVTVTVYVLAVRPLMFCEVAVYPPLERDQLYADAGSPAISVLIEPVEPPLHATFVGVSVIVNVRTVQLFEGFGVYPIEALFPLPLRQPLVPLSYVNVPE
jgi:hypothetical protein